jgi:hypothetical protein
MTGWDCHLSFPGSGFKPADRTTERPDDRTTERPNDRTTGT